jgi:hypothetical protein
VNDKSLDDRDIVSTFTVVGDNVLEETQVQLLERQYTE